MISEPFKRTAFLFEEITIGFTMQLKVLLDEKSLTFIFSFLFFTLIKTSDFYFKMCYFVCTF